MADNDDHRHADIIRRLERVESDLGEVVRNYPTDRDVTARLATIHLELSQLRTEIGRTDGRVTTLAERFENWREALRNEAASRRNVILAATFSVVAVVVAAIFLSGLQIGG